MKIILTTLAGIVLFWAGHTAATAARGYSAVGGEIAFLIAIPITIGILIENTERGM